MLPVTLKENFHWVGVIDWNIRNFHGYSTYKGSTYNAYLALDEKVTLFDIVKQPFAGELLKNIRALTPRVDYIVVNHVEMDHSGSFLEVVEALRPEKIFCSPMGEKALRAHFHDRVPPLTVVKSGETLSLGKRTVKFLETRMLHWPDSMFSYLPEDGVLISSDAFGQHWATSERFDDEVDPSELMAHAAKYYANILLPYSGLVQKLLADLAKMNLKIDLICPDHGLMWRGNPGAVIGAYDRWGRQEAKKKAVIAFATMWHSTEAMAEAVAEGLESEGVSVRFMCLDMNHRSDIVHEVLEAKALLVGSPTLNNGIFPSMGDFLTYLRGLKPLGKIGAAFGSYGWSGEAVKVMTETLREMKFEIVDEGVRVQYVPKPEDLARCVELGRKVGRAIASGPA